MLRDLDLQEEEYEHRPFFPSPSAYLKLPSIRSLCEEDHDPSLYEDDDNGDSFQKLNDLMVERQEDLQAEIHADIKAYRNSFMSGLVGKVVNAFREAYLRSQGPARTAVTSPHLFAVNVKRTEEEDLALLESHGLVLTCRACKLSGRSLTFAVRYTTLLKIRCG